MHREVNLVIKNEKSMDILLKYLIWTLNTIDGKRNSAAKKVHWAYECEFGRQQKRYRKSIAGEGFFLPTEYLVNDMVKSQILDLKKREIYRETFFRLRLIRIRSKISYHAYQQNVTINELILKQILKSFE